MTTQMRLARPDPWGSALFPVHPDAAYKQRVADALNNNPAAADQLRQLAFSTERHPDGPCFEVVWKVTPRGARFILATRSWHGCVTKRGIDHGRPAWRPWEAVGGTR